MKNIKKLWLLLCFGLFTFMTGTAQQQHSISLKPGFFVNLYKDEVSYPLTHWVTTFGVKIGYEYETDINVHYGELSFSMGEARDRTYGTENLRRWTDSETNELMEKTTILDKLSIDAHLNYSYHHKVLETSGYSLSPGVEFDFNFNMLLADYPTVSSLISLAPSIQQKYEFSEDNDIRLTVSMPLANFVVRPPFVGVDDEILNMVSENPLLIYQTGNFATLDTYFSLFAKLDYRHRFLPWLEGTIGLQSRYSYTADPRPKRDFRIELLPGINIKL